MPPPRKTTKAKTTPATTAAPVAPVAAAAPAAPIVERSEVKGSGKTKAAAAPAAPRTLSHDEIAKRAFEIYASRGYAPGDPAADWSEAERQLKAGL